MWKSRLPAESRSVPTECSCASSGCRTLRYLRPWTFLGRTFSAGFRGTIDLRSVGQFDSLMPTPFASAKSVPNRVKIPSANSVPNSIGSVPRASPGHPSTRHLARSFVRTRAVDYLPAFQETARWQVLAVAAILMPRAFLREYRTTRRCIATGAAVTVEWVTKHYQRKAQIGPKVMGSSGRRNWRCLNKLQSETI